MHLKLYVKWQAHVTLTNIYFTFYFFFSLLCSFDGSVYFNVRASEIMRYIRRRKKKIIHQTTVSINCLWIVNILDDGCQFNHCIYFHLSFNVITIVFRQRPNDATSIQKKLFCLLKFWYFDIFFSESIKNNSIPSESFAFTKFIINVTDICLSHIYYILPFFRCVSWSRSFFCAFNWGGFFIQFSVQFVQCYKFYVSAFYGNYI